LLAALHSDGTVESACPDCDQPISVSVLNVALAGAEAVVHFLGVLPSLSEGESVDARARDDVVCFPLCSSKPPG
jgi:hypothetical protein